MFGVLLFAELAQTHSSRGMLSGSSVGKILRGAVVGLVWSVAGYANRRTKQSAKFSARTAGQTVLIGIVCGAAVPMAGQELTAANLEQMMFFAVPLVNQLVNGWRNKIKNSTNQ